ncbi:hypothetical protein AT05_08370 [Schleiferia thermophila str. Yellowstone]|uniref:T9SS type A sorting domain-containing protein n=1 Tax=Schleiferia thermophila TaxID=884107 RepID=UPI0004E717B1|nr:T9SS type A sorting domain-containing protein [Schleiferia thermophila]KFD38871.1 hypothetical protein AT05_08370 [Schleiferia thermophila str. Yellowstone]
MKRWIFKIVPLLWIFLHISHTNAQIREMLYTPLRTPMAPPQAKILSSDTIELPVIDDFSYLSILPSQSIWSDIQVTVTRNKATGQITIGTATFDGLDEYGQPYHPTQIATDTCDMLTSRYINLANRTNVWLSFYYQPGGLGEFPEPDDSLALYFWSPDDSTWTSVWRETGPQNQTLTPFKLVMIPVDNVKFLKKGFRFRFVSYGAPSGAFDEWHIDYVYLDANRNANDTLIPDPAFVKEHPQVISGAFSAVPWWTFNNSMLVDQVSHRYRKNGIPGSQNLVLGQYRAFSGPNLIASGNGSPTIDDNHPYNTEVEFIQPFTNPLSLPFTPTGEFSIDVQSFFAGANAGLRENDTISHRQEFRNYYSYDDGSPERAFGIVDQGGAITLINLTPLTPDTLVGLYINFVYAGVDATQNEFKIVVYQNLQGIPSTKLYESPEWLRPEYPPRYQNFIEYPLSEPVYINTPVYIGVKQKTIHPLNIGFDVNSPGRHLLVFGDGTNWFQSVFQGSLMIRPYFRYQPLDLSVSEETLSDLPFIALFPNPTSERFFIQIPENQTYLAEMYTIDGKVVKRLTTSGKLTEVPINDLPDGMYLVRLTNLKNHNTQHLKLIKKN